MFTEYDKPWEVAVPDKVKVVTTFSGYDSQCLGMEMLKEWAEKNGKHFDYELLAWSEFDPESTKPIDEQPAVVAHNLLFPQWKSRNLGDITKADFSKFADAGVDLLTYCMWLPAKTGISLLHGLCSSKCRAWKISRSFLEP